MNKYIIGLIVAIPGWYLASFIGKLASEHAKRLDKKMQNTRITIILSKFIQPLIIFICVVLAINFFPPYPTMKQRIKNLATTLTRTEKAWLAFGFQSKHKGVPKEAVVVQNYLNELGELPDSTSATLYTTAHQSLAAKGLIKDLPLKPGKSNSEITFTIEITNNGEKVFHYLVRNNLF